MSGSSSSSSSSSRSRGGNGGSGSAIDEGDEGLMMRFSRGSLGEFLGDTPLLGINFFLGGGLFSVLLNITLVHCHTSLHRSIS